MVSINVLIHALLVISNLLMPIISCLVLVLSAVAIVINVPHRPIVRFVRVIIIGLPHKILTQLLMSHVSISVLLDIPILQISQVLVSAVNVESTVWSVLTQPLALNAPVQFMSS